MALADAQPSRFVRILERVFEFCASLKLAIGLILSLAGYLAAATFYEARYGPHAVQAVVYGSPLFVVLMALLAINVMAAALIRYPFKRKHTGFVITHIGLEILLAGCLLSGFRSTDGRVAISEGGSTDLISLTSEQIAVALPGGQRHAVPLDLWRDAGHPSLFRFLASPFLALPDVPRWRDGHSVSRSFSDGVKLEILDWLPVAKADLANAPAEAAPTGSELAPSHPQFTFRPARVAPDKLADALRAVKVALTLDGHRSEHWLGRGMMPRRISTPRGGVTLAYGFDGYRLPFTLKVLDFEKKNDPSSDAAASFICRVAVSTPAGTSEHVITLNDPLTVAGTGGLTFYQAGYDDTAATPITVLSVRRDPGTYLKYVGSSLVVLGIFTMFYMRAYFQRPARAAALADSAQPAARFAEEPQAV